LPSSGSVQEPGAFLAFELALADEGLREIGQRQTLGDIDGMGRDPGSRADQEIEIRLLAQIREIFGGEDGQPPDPPAQAIPR
jgi:hypothetical protein